MAVQTLTYQCPHCKKPVDVDLPLENETMVCPHPDCQKPFKPDVPSAQPVQGLVLPPGTNGVAEQPASPVEAPPGTLREFEGRPGCAGASPSAGGLGGPSRPPILVNTPAGPGESGSARPWAFSPSRPP